MPVGVERKKIDVIEKVSVGCRVCKDDCVIFLRGKGIVKGIVNDSRSPHQSELIFDEEEFFVVPEILENLRKNMVFSISSKGETGFEISDSLSFERYDRDVEIKVRIIWGGINELNIVIRNEEFEDLVKTLKEWRDSCGGEHLRKS